MIIKSKEVLKNFKGDTLKAFGNDDLTVGVALSEILLQAEEGSKMKMFVMAQRFYEGKEIEVDKVDLQLIKNAIEKTKAFPGSLVTGQLLLILSKEETKKEVKKK